MSDPLTNPPTEEERRRKIIIDSQVARAASRGIKAAAQNELTGKQVRDLISIDEDYLMKVGMCAPDLVPVDNE